MRTNTSNVTFCTPVTPNEDLGRLPAASYELEVDEEETQVTKRTGYRRASIFFSGGTSQ